MQPEPPTALPACYPPGQGSTAMLVVHRPPASVWQSPAEPITKIYLSCGPFATVPRTAVWHCGTPLTKHQNRVHWMDTKTTHLTSIGQVDTPANHTLLLHCCMATQPLYTLFRQTFFFFATQSSHYTHFFSLPQLTPLLLFSSFLSSSHTFCFCHVSS